MGNNVVDKAKEICSGCGLCVQVCNVKCLEMEPNHEGFLFPHIDRASCIDCGVCLQRCPMKRADTYYYSELNDNYAVIHNNPAVLLSSSSGGAFSAIANAVLDNGGVIYGAVFNKDLVVRHQAALDSAGLEQMRGSKYVQSDLSSVYADIREHLNEGRQVLFSGTPCQVAAIREWNKNSNSHLITVDLVCHGVPSPAMFEKHMIWLQGRYKHEVVEYQFRSKEKAYWGQFKAQIRTTQGNYGQLGVSDPYYAAFLRCETFRESCYICPFSCGARVADLTICDYWGIEVEHPTLDASQGVSAIMVNTHMGGKLFQTAGAKLTIQPTTSEQIARYQHNLRSPSTRPKARDIVYRVIEEEGYAAYANRYLHSPGRLFSVLRTIVPRKLKIIRRRTFH